jgi:hypothetical protein
MDRTTKGEYMLQNVAIDHWLFHELRDKPHYLDVMQKPFFGETMSPVHYDEDFIHKGKTRKSKEKAKDKAKEKAKKKPKTKAKKIYRKPELIVIDD